MAESRILCYLQKVNRSWLLLLAFAMFLGCSKEKAPEESESKEVPSSVSRPPPEETIRPAPPTPAPPAKESYPRKPSAKIQGAVEHLARLDGFSVPIHTVVVRGDYAYVDDSGGMIYRVKNTGGELEVVYDSGHGAGNHAGSLTRAGDEVYFVKDAEEERRVLHKIVDGQSVPVVEGPDILYLAGDKSHLFATVFKGNDLYRLGEEGFASFVKTPRPQEPLIDGEHLYWTSYQRGGVHRVLLNGKKKERLAKDRRTIGLAIVGEMAYYGTESDGGVHVVPTSGGPSKRIVDGFNNHDSFVADEGGVYFWTWGQPSSVLRLDASTHKVETMVHGLVAPRHLALQDGWLYLVDEGNLYRVKTDARMPWPMESE